MTDEIRRLLEQQAAWQRELRDLPWPEKLRRVAAVRESILQLIATRPKRVDPSFPRHSGPRRQS